jgi:hypothetical protein
LDSFKQCAAKLDEAFTAIATYGEEFANIAVRMHALGSIVPNGAQIDSLGYRSLLWSISASPWRNHFDLVPPHQRRSFSQLASIWIATNERSIAARLGEEEAA